MIISVKFYSLKIRLQMYRNNSKIKHYKPTYIIEKLVEKKEAILLNLESLMRSVFLIKEI
jgi:hypothetical protein